MATARGRNNWKHLEEAYVQQWLHDDDDDIYK